MLIATEHRHRIASLVGAVWPGAEVEEYEVLQRLWSDYGAIVRVNLNHPSNSVVNANSSVPDTLIAKVVVPPNAPGGSRAHPRGWNTQTSNQRKLRSYQVERHFYEEYAARCKSECSVPQCFVADSNGAAVTLLMEDLDSRFPGRRESLSLDQVKVCLQWLAAFHATFLGVKSDSLWGTGCYWHLATRQDEFNAMPDGALKRSAQQLDSALEQCRYKTLVHGDAKVANFCFSEDGQSVAAVDFQYVGGGCGMRDVAYFLGSCLDESVLERCDTELLDFYFDALKESVARTTSEVDVHALINEWRALYAVAEADFHRFLSGWSPNHWKLTGYSRAMVTRALHFAENYS